MDRSWGRAWQQAFGQGGPPTTEWRIYPEHPFSVGTNYGIGIGEDSLAVTWNSRKNCNTQVVFSSELELNRAGWGHPVKSSPRAETLQRLGLFDSEMSFRGFAYHRGDRLDEVLRKLSNDYADLVARAYDYEQLGKFLNIPADELFVIVLHETAYAIFEALNRAGKLEFPAVLKNGADTRGCRSLVSVLLLKPPAIEDEAMSLYHTTPGSPQTVEAFRQLAREKPEDWHALLYLGLSLYDAKNYREAIETFQKLSKVSEAQQAKIHGWSHIWIGHMYDLLGEREAAIQQYQSALASKDANDTWQFSQYNIGPITTKAWAQERIATPFTRR
jgi:tetratricopeptide (TPR) repeat protein